MECAVTFLIRKNVKGLTGGWLLGGHLGCLFSLVVDEYTRSRWDVDSEELKLHPENSDRGPSSCLL